YLTPEEKLMASLVCKEWLNDTTEAFREDLELVSRHGIPLTNRSQIQPPLSKNQDDERYLHAKLFIGSLFMCMGTPIMLSNLKKTKSLSEKLKILVCLFLGPTGFGLSLHGLIRDYLDWTATKALSPLKPMAAEKEPLLTRSMCLFV